MIRRRQRRSVGVRIVGALVLETADDSWRQLGHRYPAVVIQRSYAIGLAHHGKRHCADVSCGQRDVAIGVRGNGIDGLDLACVVQRLLEARDVGDIDFNVAVGVR
ncbi:hypothetical protein D3C87_1729130 [compost metagenome]